ncbi:hypothetical protein IQ06DRAFT_84714 [Phaeosphaeriaceae sp. SRC1lsM3a]|nr:hypothetical protein IQ06DRAFT_84714 [Stagonospora sp. SRC1lsM3a]
MYDVAASHRARKGRHDCGIHFCASPFTPAGVVVELNSTSGCKLQVVVANSRCNRFLDDRSQAGTEMTRNCHGSPKSSQVAAIALRHNPRDPNQCQCLHFASCSRSQFPDPQVCSCARWSMNPRISDAGRLGNSVGWRERLIATIVSDGHAIQIMAAPVWSTL